jgi:chromosome segregation ATPase
VDLRSPLRILLVAGLTGMVGLMFVVTAHLDRLKSGIDQNLAVATSLPRVQAAVLERNRRLGQMVERSEAISRGLTGVDQHAKAIRQAVSDLGRANESILVVNQQAGEQNRAVVAELRALRDSLHGMRGAVGTVQQELRGLSQAVANDVDALQSVQITTGRMQQKTLGW